MSTQATLPDVDTAFANVYNGVYAQTYLRKMAAHGYPAQTAEAAQSLLQLAVDLKSPAQQQIKQAASDPYAGPVQALHGVLGEAGLDGHIKNAYAVEEAAAIKEAAYRLAADPVLYNSMLTLKADEAARTAQYLQQQQQQQ